MSRIIQMGRPVIEPGIYFNLAEDAYHAADGLSCSGMKQLAISPLNYWHNNLNPSREMPEETYPQRFGKAVHGYLLERDSFDDKYAVALDQDDFPDLLVTMEDLKAYCATNGLETKAKRKQELIERIQANGNHPPIWDLEQVRGEEAVAGKTVLKRQEMAHIEKLGRIVVDDPYAKAILSGGISEVSFFVRDPESGVMLKARMDYVKPHSTIDLKTFSNSRGKPTEKVVHDAIFYEKYHLQCVSYSKVRELARLLLADGQIAIHGDVSEEWLKGFLGTAAHGFGFIFIESSEPFDMRIVQLRANEAPGADANVYWLAASIQIEELTILYDECVKKYGDSPWREPAKPYMLADSDLPQLMFAS